MKMLGQAFQEHIAHSSSSTYVGLGLVFLILSFNIYKRPSLSHIPTQGFTGLLSYYDSYCFLFRAQNVLQDGYAKFRKSPGFFKVASPTRWNIIIVSPEMIDELRMAKTDEVSLDHVNEEEFATRYTLGLGATSILYHVDAVRTLLTRNLVTKFSEVYDEVVQSFEDLIPVKGDGRNPEWIELNIKYTVDVFLRAMAINVFPHFLQPFVGSLLSPIGRPMRISRKLLEKEVARRLEMEEEFGKEYDNRPNDLITWLIDCAPPEERTVESILTRILVVNISAIHTTSTNFYQALLRLATHPEYVAPMREEVLGVIDEYGWTKEALNKMRKVDSFLKESVRYEGMGGLMVQRKIIKKSGYTFANGLHLPHDSWIGVPTFAIHHDPDYYEDPLKFHGFRFSKIRQEEGEELKHQMVSTNLHYLNFGHGRHACPGRFFAVTELKTMLAHVLLTYEVKLESDPQPFWFGTNIAPDEKVKVLFRRLKTST